MKRFGWMWGFLLGLSLLGGLAAPGSGESPTGVSLVQLKNVAVEPREGGLAVQIKTSGPAAYETSLIDRPTRLIIDLESTGYGWRKTPLPVGLDPIRQIRGGQFRKGVVRIVVELTRKVGYRIDEGPEGLTVMLEPSATPQASVKAESKPAEVAKAEPSAPEAKPADAEAGAAIARPAGGTAPAPKPEAAKAPEPATVAQVPAPEAEAKEEEGSAPRQPTLVAAVPAPVRVAQTAQPPAPPEGSRLISLDFKDADITNILRLLAAESSRNIVSGEDVRGKISISLNNVPWELALETILEAKGLEKVEKDNVLRIVSTEQLTKEREAKARAEEAKVKGEAEARTKLAEAQLKEAEAQQKKLLAEAAIAEAKARGPLKEDTIRLNYADPEEVAKTLQGILGIPEGGAPAPTAPIAQPGVTPSIGLGTAPPIAQPPFSALYGPGAAGAAAAGAPVSASAEVLAKGLTIRAHKPTNTIFLRLFEKDLERVKKLIQETLDVALPQVKIEARMEILDRPSLIDIGIQWGGAGATRDGRNVLVGQGFTDAVPPVGRAGIAQIPGALGFPGKVNPSIAAGLGSLLPVDAATGLPTGGNIVNLPFTGGATSQPAAGGINFGIIGTRMNVNLALQALERLNKTKSIAHPEIVTVENKPAQMSLGEEIPYQTVSSAGTQVQFKEAVLSLTVTPTVIREVDITKIKMKIIVENNTRGTVTAGVPAINKRRAETEVIVKEGEILVIGGVKQSITTDTVTKVPLLGDIPFLGWLFKRKTFEIDPDRELVIFISPSIVKGGSPYPSPRLPAEKLKGS